MRLLDRNRRQGPSAQRYRPKQILMLLGAADAYRRREHGWEPFGDLAADRVSEDAVRAKGKMRALILDRAERHDDGDDAAIDQLTQFRRAQLLQLVRHPASIATDQAAS
jgi:hypothetical protein